MTSLFPQHFKSQLCLLVVMSSYRIFLPFTPNCPIACITRSVGITNIRHVTKGDGLEPRDIATVKSLISAPGRACGTQSTGAAELLQRVSGRSLDSLHCGQQLELIRGASDTTPGIHAQLFGLNLTYLQFLVKDFAMLKSTACSSAEPIHVDSTSRAHDYVQRQSNDIHHRSDCAHAKWLALLFAWMSK